MRIPQLSFAAGEVSPQIYGRVDIAKYHVGLEKCLNGIVLAQGGIQNRPGYEFIAPAKFHDTEARLVPFSYNTEQTYVLVLGDEYMWVLKDGGVVLNSTQNITAITAADPGVITITGHGYSNGDWVFVTGISGMTELNGRFFKVANVTTNTYTLQDQRGNDINTSAFTAYTSGGTVASVYDVTTPYDEADLATLNFTQSANTMTFAHKSYAPRDLTRSGHSNWTLSTISFGSALAAPTSISASATTGSGSTTYDYTVTAEDDDNGEISLPGTGDTCTNDLGTAGNENTITWSSVSGAERYNVYKKKNGIYGWIGQTTTTSFIDDNIGPDMTKTPPENVNPFNGSNNYPGAVMFHEQRKVFGGTNNNPNRFDGSQIGRYNNFNKSRPVVDDDAYQFGIVAEDVQEIRHFVSLTDLLAFTSNGVWKISPGSSGDTIENDSISVLQQSVDGIREGTKPLVVGNTILFVHDGGKTVGDIGYSFADDGYQGDDLSIMSKHLFRNKELLQWTWHKEPHRCAFAVRDDGVKLGFTYQRKHEVWAWHRHITDGKFKSLATIREGNENFTYAIIERTIGGETYRYIERMKSREYVNIDEAFFVDSGLTVDNWNYDTTSSVTLSGGTVIGGTGDNADYWPAGDALTLTENAGLSPFAAGDVGKEIVLAVFDSDGVILDRCRFEVTGHTSSTVIEVTPKQAVPPTMQGVALTRYGFAQSTISNLWHLEGKVLKANADGTLEGSDDDLEVTDGSVTLQTPAVQCHIGIPYNFDMKTLRIVGSPQNAAAVGQKMSIPYADIFVDETLGIQAGPDFDNLSPYFQRDYNEEDWGEPTEPVTGPIRMYMKSDWNEGQFVIRQSDPFPISVLSIIPEIELGG